MTPKPAVAYPDQYRALNGQITKSKRWHNADARGRAWVVMEKQRVSPGIRHNDDDPDNSPGRFAIRRR
jgi:hypothetical protein